MPLILTRTDVEAILDMDLALEAARSAFEALAGDGVEMPERLVLDVKGRGVHLSMPCHVAFGGLATKVVTVFPAASPSIRGIVILHSDSDGAPLAIMDAEYMTAMRTGAASGLATSLLAREDSLVLAVFGAGAQARTQIEAVRRVRSIERVLIVNRTLSRGEALGREIGAEVSSCDDAIAVADVICTATDSPGPLFDGNSVRAGTHINAIGSYRPDRRELDSALMGRARVFVDHESAVASAGEFVLADDTWSHDRLEGTLASLVVGEAAGRTAQDEITVFKSVGVAVQDVLCASMVYERAVALGKGTAFDLDS